MLVVVLYALFKITQTTVSNAKIAIGKSLSCPVRQCFGKAKRLFVVVYVFFRINVTPVSKFLARVVTTSLYCFYVRV